MTFAKDLSTGISRNRFWGLTAYFNPQRYRSRKLLYDIFRDKTKTQGLPLLAVELAFGSAPFELHAGDAEILVQLRAGRDGIMWQKERLLNIGLSQLPAECDMFAWLDCDVIFDNPNWIRETETQLQRFSVVQPFSISVRLPRGKTSVNIQAANQALYDRRPSSGYAFTYAQSSPLVDYMLTGHTGFAWAARRSLFDGIGMYDRMIAGGGDVVLACGFYARPTNRFTHLLPDALVRDQQQWIHNMAGRVAGSVSYTRGGLFHLWHGTQRSRMTLERLQLLFDYSFDPLQDVHIDSSGCFVWKGTRPALQSRISRFFWQRNEDDSQVREGLRKLADTFVNRRSQSADFARSTFAKVTVNAQLALRQFFRPAQQSQLSLIVMNWKRPRLVEKLVETYSAYPAIRDIVVWNNNPACLPDLSRHPYVKLVTCRHDAGLDSRWAASTLADSDHLLIHDDDVLLTEPALDLLFSRYLDHPALIHGIRGRNLSAGYNARETFGKVDVALTTCLIINKRFIPAYFQCVTLFDELRSYGCGNGEDIIMNYVVRRFSGQWNRAHLIPYWDADKDPDVAMHSICRRPHHLKVRNEITRRCVEQLSAKRARFKIDDYGLDELSRIFPATWVRYHEAPEDIVKPENFFLSDTISRQQFEAALSLLCRRSVSLSMAVTATGSANPGALA